MDMAAVFFTDWFRSLIPILLLTAIGVSAYIITRPTKAEPTR